MVRTPLYLSVDVGTGSARAALFTSQGEKMGYSSHRIKTRNERENHYEQSSSDIWNAIKISVRDACRLSRPGAGESHFVAAIGIDATCSLVACSDDGDFAPLSVVADADGADDGEVYNIMLWLDRRAIEEAEHINTIPDNDVKLVRSHFGDRLSPENEPPKLLWLNKHKPDLIQRGIFFDLADWVAFRCCGDPHVRSSCTVACKWGWGSDADESGNGAWTASFWERLGMSKLCENNFRKIGTNIVKPGQPIGNLCREAAEELGLTTECLVASPMIDAHAGSLWSLGAKSLLLRQIAPASEQRLSVICGTSTCFIELSQKPLFIKGVWGPFRDAVLSGFHVTEGGQSVTGKLLENTVERHPAFKALQERVGPDKVYDTLAEMTETLIEQGLKDPAEHFHCLDYHAGNRSPLADPTLKGSMIGLTLSADEVDLAVKFRATIQALCYGARHIIDSMRHGGHTIGVITACGGLCKSKLFLKELADCVSIPVVLSSEEDTVLLGGAILGRAAHSLSLREEDSVSCILRTASEMTVVGKSILPDRMRKDYHDRKYLVYRELHADYLKYRLMMDPEYSITK